jgi:soluble lytic murein transglycosylase-like protein
VCHAQIPREALAYRGDLTREAQFVFGINAYVPALAAQIEQESGWRANVTAFDNGRGLGQLMDGTSKWLVTEYPELGAPEPYDPIWSIRALLRLNAHNLALVRGANDCEKWGATLKSYNSGVGYVLRAQGKSAHPETWFGYSEYINAGQSEANFEASRMYPRLILYTRQPKYLTWGKSICLSH